MPWKVTDVMEERIRFVEASLEGPGEYEQVVPTVWDQPKHGLRVVESVSGEKGQ